MAPHDLNPSLKFEKCLHFAMFVQLKNQYCFSYQLIEWAYLQGLGMNSEALQEVSCISCNPKFVIKFFFSFNSCFFHYLLISSFDLHPLFPLLNQLV
jgi:hypothetical protein